MIVRISSEGQYEITDVEALNRLDNAAAEAIDSGDEVRFHAAYAALLAFTRGGRALNEDELEGSDVILPPADVTLEEARSEFSGEGLLPS
jgi:hypothetical protein